MATYEIKEVAADAVYVVVTLEDGSTFGQTIYNARGETKADLLKLIDDRVSAALAQVERPQATPQDLRSEIGKPRPITRRSASVQRE